MLLEAARWHWAALQGEAKACFRFHHVPTDEVFGSLGAAGFFHEDSPSPTRPTPRAKPAPITWRAPGTTPTVCRRWHRSAPTTSGPIFLEKLSSLVILNALEGKPLPEYGAGANVRDWLYVQDHAHALVEIATRGVIGESYNVGGWNERRHIDVVDAICDLVDEMASFKEIGARKMLITFVTDRPGHDERYAIGASKIKHELG